MINLCQLQVLPLISVELDCMLLKQHVHNNLIPCFWWPLEVLFSRKWNVYFGHVQNISAVQSVLSSMQLSRKLDFYQ